MLTNYVLYTVRGISIIQQTWDWVGVIHAEWIHYAQSHEQAVAIAAFLNDPTNA